MRISLKISGPSKSLVLSTYKLLMYALSSSRGKRIAKQPGIGTRISKVKLRLTVGLSPIHFFCLTCGVPLNMTPARCPKMDDETIPIHRVLLPNCSQVFTFDDGSSCSILSSNRRTSNWTSCCCCCCCCCSCGRRRHWCWCW